MEKSTNAVPRKGSSVVKRSSSDSSSTGDGERDVAASRNSKERLSSTAEPQSTWTKIRESVKLLLFRYRIVTMTYVMSPAEKLVVGEYVA